MGSNGDDCPDGKCSVEQLRNKFKDFARPKDWKKDLWELDTEHPENNGFQNEDLIVWMRTAALPNFRKLYRRVQHTIGTEFEKGLPAKYEYQLEIGYNYPVTDFSG